MMLGIICVNAIKLFQTNHKRGIWLQNDVYLNVGILNIRIKRQKKNIT